MLTIEAFSYCPCCAHTLSKESSVLLQCPQCSFRFYQSPKPAVAVLIKNSKGELLLSRRNIEPHKGTLELPGGFVDPDETFEKAIIREVFEELGIHIQKSDLHYFTSVTGDYVYQDITYKVVFPVYSITLEETPTFKQDEREIQNIAFYPTKEIDPEHIGLMGDREAVKQFLSL